MALIRFVIQLPRVCRPVRLNTSTTTRAPRGFGDLPGKRFASHHVDRRVHALGRKRRHCELRVYLSSATGMAEDRRNDPDNLAGAAYATATAIYYGAEGQAIERSFLAG